MRKGKLQFRVKGKTRQGRTVKASVDACGNWHCADPVWLEWLQTQVPADIYSGPAHGWPVPYYIAKAADALKEQGIKVTKIDTPTYKAEPGVYY